MAHVRRKFVDIHRAQVSAIADEAIRRIAQLYAIEKEARGSPPDRRVEIRQAKAKPIFDDLEVWLHARLPSISGKSPLALAIRYALTRMARMRPYLELLSNLVFEGLGPCGDLVWVGGSNSVFECDAGDNFGEVIKAA
jgi:hypothetical protein